MTSETRDLTRLIITAALPPTITGIAALLTSLANNRRIKQNNQTADIARVRLNEKADIANSKADLIAEKTDAIQETTNSLAALRDELREQAARGMVHVASMEEDIIGLKILVSGLLETHEGVENCPFSRNAAKVLENEPG
jgi:hypothetical protein